MAGVRQMANKKTCSACGAELTFNRSTGFYECRHCGTIHKPGVDNRPLSIETVDEFMHGHRYEDAKHVLDKLIAKEPENPYFLLRAILLEYKMNELDILLASSKNSRNMLDKISSDEGWEKLRDLLPEDKKDLTSYVSEYCRTSLDILYLKELISEKRKLISSNPASGRDETMDMGVLNEDELTGASSDDAFDIIIPFVISLPLSAVLAGVPVFFIANILCEITESFILAFATTIIICLILTVFFSKRRKDKKIMRSNEDTPEEIEIRQKEEEIRKNEASLDELLLKIKEIENGI